MKMPKLYVLARPSTTEGINRFLSDESQSWVQSSCTEAERIVEFAGRICYMSFGPRQSSRINREYIRNLIAQGHESVLEHVSWTFLLTGVSRAFTHQLVRHRIGFSYSQLSQQYHDESDADFVPPAGLEGYPDLLEIWDQTVQSARHSYKEILSKLESQGSLSRESLRLIRSAARSVLPNATESKIVVTANARAIRHFLDARGALEGDVEMRKISKLIYDIMIEDAPSMVADFECQTLADGTPLILKSLD